ncbi:MAG: DUF302 domain-containing protein [Bacteroidota bacterium]|nr:DUF302 domain-containing protein [Bacteroidota bacterium]
MKKLISKWLIGDITQKYTTMADYDLVMEKLTETAVENKFSVVTIHNLRESYSKKNLKIDDDFEYRIVEICNAQKSHKVITEMSYDMGVMMPKSIIVARENGKTTLRFMKMKPWIMSMMFPSVDIVPMSKNVMKIMTNIVIETIKKAEA